ncbi:Solute carrier family 49 member A3 [Nymphon striatum]|nr:Solute carrier family 49 member A3 [Nymphon striatum]
MESMEQYPSSPKRVSVTPSENIGVRHGDFTVYKWRWYVLAVVALLNISNAAVWISFSSVSNYTAVFYGRSTDDINYFSTVYFIATIPLGLVAMVVIDNTGLRLGVLIGACLNATGAIIRAISTATFIPQHDMFWMSMLGQTIAGISQAFVLIIPTKVAETWFPDNQRAIATTVVSMANPIGIIVGFAIPPIIVHEANGVRLMNIVVAIPCVVAALLAIFGIRNSSPPTPPSFSATVEVKQAYLPNLKMLGTNVAYIILAITLGAGLGGVSALMTILQPFLCSRGYSDDFTGLCGALLIASGLVGAGITGTIVDKTKTFTEATKICFCFAAFSAIFFSIIVQKHGLEIPVALSCCLVGFFGFAAYPVGLELGVECSYPVPEATSSGIIIVLGQILGVLLVQIMTALRENLSSYDLQFATCVVGSSSSTNSSVPASSVSSAIKAYDMTIPGLIFAGFLSIITVILVIFFKTDYKRLNAETANKTQNASTIYSTNPGSRSSGRESGGLKVNAGKSEVISCDKDGGEVLQVKANIGEKMKQVKQFKYLGMTVNETGGCEKDVREKSKSIMEKVDRSVWSDVRQKHAEMVEY